MNTASTTERTKFAVTFFEGKALTWWRAFSSMSYEHQLGTLTWSELVEALENEF